MPGQMVTKNNAVSILGLDVGERRVGVARALLAVPIPRPLVTLSEPDRFLDDIVRLVDQEAAGAVVLGLPRGMDGQDTAQTRLVRDFGDRLSRVLNVPLHWTDEALTSHKAEEELARRGKQYAKGVVDALAATYILEDFLRESGGRYDV